MLGGLFPVILGQLAAVMRLTPLAAEHRAAGAKLIEFAGWEMPLHYGSQIDEHHAVRRDAGVFDISHMLALDVNGSAARTVEMLDGVSRTARGEQANETRNFRYFSNARAINLRYKARIYGHTWFLLYCGSSFQWRLSPFICAFINGCRNLSILI